MPWIIADYTSPTIDLSDPKTFRDLSKPMGALNETRLKEFLDRYYSFEENVTSGIPPFMYGSHYSTMVGVVLHFLVRLQPFASLHKEMQNGHFDVSDRLFSSIPRSFSHNTTQLSEVKEITPEWFTTPDMFRNINNFHFGYTQDAELVNDVELPPWASSPEEFVRINREALESDYVTEHLHEWIDLIFGYKQRGSEAVEARNVFYYLTYYGAVDHYRIEDEALRRATELQIAHFGQTPMQLFKVPHPTRKVSGPNAVLPLSRPLKKVFNKADVEELIPPTTDEESIAISTPCTLLLRKSPNVVVLCSILVDRIICVLDNGVIEVLKFATSEEAKAALQAHQIALKSQGKKGGNLNSTHENSNHSFKGIAAEDLLFPDLTDTSNGKSAADTPEDSSFTASSTHSDHEYESPLQWLREGESLIHVEKETTHFDNVPRIPLKLNRYDDGGSNSNKTQTISELDPFVQSPTSKSFIGTESYYEQLARMVLLNRTSKLSFSYGSVDGTVTIREIDSKAGTILSAGDFCSHRRRVVSVSVDSNMSDHHVVGSIDITGTIFVWTVFHPKTDISKTSFVISRRPQRQFRIDPHPDGLMHCEISWQMGIIVANSGPLVSIFSIERNELLRSFSLHNDNASLLNNEMKLYEFSCNGLVGSMADYIPSMEKSMAVQSGSGDEPTLRISRMVISDIGMVILHAQGFGIEDSLLEYEDYEHWLFCYSLSGVRTNRQRMVSPVTCLVCPDDGEIVISGHQNGSVYFYRCQDLTLLHHWQPHAVCVPMAMGLSVSKKGNRSDSFGSNSSERKNISFALDRAIDSSAIISISVGPNRQCPALLCVTTEAGNIYLKALPDFIKWEKNRSPSAFAHLGNVSLQAMKGTLMQAQNWTAETAGVFAQNARTLADDAMCELKKVWRLSIFPLS